MQFHIHFSAIAKTIRRNYGGTHYKVKMNDMPVPEGDFMAAHAKRQQTHNGVLALGLCMSGFGLTMVSNSFFSSSFSATFYSSST